MKIVAIRVGCIVQNRSDIDRVTITFTVGDGAPGVDNDPHNPLARALQRLFRTGQPFERLHACYFNPLPLAKGIRWFGVFVYSDAGRVIYFPGLTEPQPQLQAAHGTTLIRHHELQVDHLSLEKDLREWHFTGKGPKSHIGTYRTTDLGEGRVLWFGMSIVAPTVLRPLKTRTEIEAEVPAKDAVRRNEVLMKAREAVVFNDLAFNRQLPQFIIPSFAHFSIVVGSCGFTPYQGQTLGLPFGSPFIKPPLPDPVDNVAPRQHRVSLEPYVDLDIITMVLPGQVKVPATFTSP